MATPAKETFSSIDEFMKQYSRGASESTGSQDWTKIGRTIVDRPGTVSDARGQAREVAALCKDIRPVRAIIKARPNIRVKRKPSPSTNMWRSATLRWTADSINIPLHRRHQADEMYARYFIGAGITSDQIEDALRTINEVTRAALRRDGAHILPTSATMDTRVDLVTWVGCMLQGADVGAAFNQTTIRKEFSNFPATLWYNNVLNTQMKQGNVTLIFNANGRDEQYTIGCIRLTSSHIYGTGIESRSSLLQRGSGIQYVTLLIPSQLMQTEDEGQNTILTHTINSWQNTAAQATKSVMGACVPTVTIVSNTTILKGYGNDAIFNDIGDVEACTYGSCRLATLTIKCQVVNSKDLSAGMGVPSAYALRGALSLTEDIAIPRVVDFRAIRFIPMVMTALGKLRYSAHPDNCVVHLSNTSTYGLESPRGLKYIHQHSESALISLLKLSSSKLLSNDTSTEEDMASAMSITDGLGLLGQASTDKFAQERHFDLGQWGTRYPPAAMVHIMKSFNTMIILAWVVTLVGCGTTFIPMKEGDRRPSNGLEALDHILTTTYESMFLSTEVTNAYEVFFSSESVRKFYRLSNLVKQLTHTVSLRRHESLE
uniref:Uncharacterized protein n=1 Tax=viral metagenome TaxID=1070528 RepID=A0A2V0R8Y9_9ZZZZ